MKKKHLFVSIIMLESIYIVAIRTPLKKLFLLGPKFSILAVDFGFLGGVTEIEACSQLTGVALRHWEQNELVCVSHLNDYVDRVMLSFLIILYFLVFFALIWKIGNVALKQITLVCGRHFEVLR